MTRYADVIVPLPLQDSYTYSIPSALEPSVQRGCRVLVPFGKNKSYVGIVRTLHTKEPQGYEVKPIKECLDDQPVVTEAQFRFWEWIAQYYVCPLGDVMNAALPARLKEETVRKPQVRQKNSSSVQIDEEERSHNKLNRPQQQAYDAICQSFLTKEVTLLHGVTSSGKTEIYIHLIRQAIAEGKQVLYLLPEIALTTQITERLRSVFGDEMGVFHSKFTDAARVAVYRKQLSDHPYQLILGVRSSVFLPFHQLGLVIVDEEHEVSYKQQDPAPRYHARSAAIMLAHQCGAKTLLGTATPSLESYHLAHTGRYGYVGLTTRYLDIQLPEIEVVDIKRLKFQKRMKGIFSPILIDFIGEALARGEQVILFQNRRGYANFLMCKTCGWVPQCPHCDVSLTYHKKTNRLVCHYCGQTFELPEECPSCGEKVFSDVGIGTEKVEQQIRRYFPEATTVRMDIDTTHTRTAYEQIITDFSRHQYDILIGTQMVSKGLDFDNVSVVGILDADTMLNIPDFRSHERTYHVLAQVAGRAGRRNTRGKVVLQTRSADSDTIAHVVQNDYVAMFRTQMEERRQFHYPPFYRLINIYLRHNDYARTELLANDFGNQLRQVFGDRVLGPDRPPVARVHSMYVRKLMLKIEKKASANKVRSILFDIQNRLLQQPSAHGVQIYYDVDPV
ncbi:MAG: primosomal protein N' [Bacteroidaceae bacterium]|nr:primosomal protein N' [Bacteroidaceae bacterium]